LPLSTATTTLTGGNIDWDLDALSPLETSVTQDLNNITDIPNCGASLGEEKSYSEWDNLIFDFKPISGGGFDGVQKILKVELTSAMVEEQKTQKNQFGGVGGNINQDGTSIYQIPSTVVIMIPAENIRDNDDNPIDPASIKIHFDKKKISNGITGTELEESTNVAPTSGDLFIFDVNGNHWQYNWKTKGLTKGTYAIMAIVEYNGVMTLLDQQPTDGATVKVTLKGK
jgi:hypothetical protein